MLDAITGELFEKTVWQHYRTMILSYSSYRLHSVFLADFNRVLPELVESLFVSFKHVSDVDIQGVGCVPVLQPLEVGVVCESHGVRRR